MQIRIEKKNTQISDRMSSENNGDPSSPPTQKRNNNNSGKKCDGFIYI